MDARALARRNETKRNGILDSGSQSRAEPSGVGRRHRRHRRVFPDWRPAKPAASWLICWPALNLYPARASSCAHPNYDSRPDQLTPTNLASQPASSSSRRREANANNPIIIMRLPVCCLRPSRQNPAIRNLSNRVTLQQISQRASTRVQPNRPARPNYVAHDDEKSLPVRCCMISRTSQNRTIVQVINERGHLSVKH